MKTLHSYLTRQVLASLLMTVMVFTFVLLLGNALKEISQWMSQVSIGVIATAFGLLVPFVLVFALPMGMLTATLLIFGRFSADQELTAVRASGISLLALVNPILLLSLALCGVSAVVNMEIGPRCRVAYTSLREKLLAQFSSSLLPEGRFITQFSGYIFYVGKNRNGNLEDVLVFVLQNETNVDYTVRASRGKMEADLSHKRLNITLYDSKFAPGQGVGREGVLNEALLALDLEPSKKGPDKPKIDDMTFRQLWAELRDLERRMQMPISLKSLTPEQRLARTRQIEEQRKSLMPVVFQIHRQVAFSFACFGFTLVGIPLGIRVHRRETNVGIAIALLLVAVYYSFIFVGQALVASHPELAPHLLVWVPNFVFQLAGAWLLWRVNRGL